MSPVVDSQAKSPGAPRSVERGSNSAASEGHSPGSVSRIDGLENAAAETAPAGQCQFEIFRCDEERMTSTLFSGGDWRWRLVTSSGLVLAEASGYPNETTCRTAVTELQKRAASAPVIARPSSQL